MNKEEFYERVGKSELLEVVRAAKTPQYVYFTSIIEEQLKALRQTTRNRFNIHYAVKANPNLEILSFLSSQSVGADVASIGEFDRAVSAGIPATNIEFSGPGKQEPEIRKALRSGVGALNVESIPELLLVCEISRDLGIVAPIGLRINPGSRGRTSGLQMSGDTQFGIIQRDIPEAVRILKTSTDWLSFRGIHAHVSSQELSAQVLADNIRLTLTYARDFSEEHGLEISKINFGGGWGIRYFPNQTKLNLSELQGLLFENIDGAVDQDLIMEPGRFLVGESGVFATRVLYQKESETRSFLITDGGMNANYVLAGGMGQVIRRNFEIDVLTTRSAKSEGEFVYDIAGPLCTPQDLLAKDFKSEFKIEPGDFIVFFNCGAYGPSASPINFLSHPPPAETLISTRRANVSR